MATLETQMSTALEGVSNFRDFQNQASGFFQRYDAEERSRKEYEEKRLEHEAQRNKNLDSYMKRILTMLLIIGALVTGATTLVGWFGPEIRKFLGLPGPISSVPAQSMSQDSSLRLH